MRRREFIALIGGTAVAWPVAARAQQPTLPLIGFLHSGSPSPAREAAFLHGLGELGYRERQNVLIEYRWAEGDYDRLPAAATELVSRRVAVLVAAGAVHTPLAAKAATSTIPIVFASGSDPVKFGLVASLNRPGGNITGVSFFTAQLEAKRLGLLHELVPHATTLAAFVNPHNANADNQSADLREGARTLGLQLQIVNPSSERDLEEAVTRVAQMRAGGLVVAADPFFFSQYRQLITLTARHKLPAIYEWREFVEAGGLSSYGTSLEEAYRQTGIYTGQILKGSEPAELPVTQAVKFEFLINLKTAKALGVDVPPGLSARADEVIE